MVKKRSNTELGRGTIMIAKIAIIKKTIVRSFDFAMVFIIGFIVDLKIFLFLAISFVGTL